mgnify:CR=1 FL=1
MKRSSPEPSVYSAAVRLLGMREHSRSELRQKLLTRGHAETEVEESLDRLVQQDYLNDSRFAALVFRQYSDLGRSGVERQMLRRGLAPEVWEDLVHQIDSEDEAIRARAAASKKARELPADLNDYDQVQRWRRRAAAYLMRRGFSGSVTNRALGEVLDRAKENA